VITLDELNRLSKEQFATALGAIFEHSPWVAQRAAAARPFGSRLQLLDAMRAAVDRALPGEQWALIQAHPRLGARGRSSVPLTEASSREQRRAGLDACTAEQWARLQRLNETYFARFAMPFILAVRGHDPESIIENIERRLGNEPPFERRTALREIGSIAGFRLAAAVAAPAGAEILAMRERLLRADGLAAAALLREWMLAADLEVSVDAAAYVCGRRSGSRPQAGTVVLGVHYDSRAEALRYDGRLGVLTGIALLQQFQEKGARPSFDLCVVAPAVDAEVDAEISDGTVCVDADMLRGCVTLEHAAGTGTDIEGTCCLAQLRAAGLQLGSLAIVRQGVGVFYRPAAAPDAALLDSAVRVLEEFLLRNRHHG
jgi:OHCU decarboxylase